MFGKNEKGKTLCGSSNVKEEDEEAFK